MTRYRLWLALLPEDAYGPTDREPAFAGPVSDLLTLGEGQELATVLRTLVSDEPFTNLSSLEPADPDTRADDAHYVCPLCGEDTLKLRRLLLDTSSACWPIGEDTPIHWFDTDSDHPDEIRIYAEWIHCPTCGSRIESRWIPPQQVGGAG